MEISKASSKKIYEIILSAKEPSSETAAAIQSLIRKAIELPEHFDFLLHRVNWFDSPFDSYHPELEKIMRIYRGRSKQSSKVVYNLLAEVLSTPKFYTAISLFKSLFEDSFHKDLII
jgi:hypothetical protein